MIGKCSSLQTLCQYLCAQSTANRESVAKAAPTASALSRTVANWADNRCKTSQAENRNAINAQKGVRVTGAKARALRYRRVVE